MRTALLTLALGLVLATAVQADDVPARRSWYQRMFPWGKKKACEPAVEDKLPPPPDPAKIRAEAEAAYHRRIGVCVRLQDIALQTRDDDLTRKADDLAQRAWESYLRRTKTLPAGMAFQSDQQTITTNLGLEGNRTPRPVAGSSRVGGDLRAAAKER